MCWLFDVFLSVAIKSQFLMVQTEKDDAERWREPTRLLLLDEKYLDKPNEELPQSVQVASFFCKLLPRFYWYVHGHDVVLGSAGYLKPSPRDILIDLKYLFSALYCAHLVRSHQGG
jgi:hypothetical protein